MFKNFSYIISLCRGELFSLGLLGGICYFGSRRRKRFWLLDFIALSAILCIGTRLYPRVIASRYNYTVMIFILIFAVFFLMKLARASSRQAPLHLLLPVLLTGYIGFGIIKTFRHDRKWETVQGIAKKINQDREKTAHGFVFSPDDNYTSRLIYYLNPECRNTENYCAFHPVNFLCQKTLSYDTIYYVMPPQYKLSGIAGEWIAGILQKSVRIAESTKTTPGIYKLSAEFLNRPAQSRLIFSERFLHPVSVRYKDRFAISKLPDDTIHTSVSEGAGNFYYLREWTITYGVSKIYGIPSIFSVFLEKTSQSKFDLRMQAKTPGRIGIHSNTRYPLNPNLAYRIEVTLRGRKQSFAEIQIYLFDRNEKFMRALLLSSLQLDQDQKTVVFFAVLDQKIAEMASSFRIGTVVTNGEITVSGIDLFQF